MVNLNPQMTITQARQWLRARLDDGATCPVCTQRAQVYKRKVTASMARALIDMYRAGRLDWVHLPSVLTGQRSDEGKLVHWGLIEEERVLRPDGGRAGYWRVTVKGERFLRSQISIPKYARIFDGHLLNLDNSQMVTIRDALGTRFNYAELMAGI